MPKDLLAAPMTGQDGTPLLDQHGQPMRAGDVLDERITTHAKQYDSAALAQLAKQLQDALDPDGDFNPDACTRRGLRLHYDSNGMLIIRGELDPAAGALFMAVIDHLASPHRRRPENEDDTLPGVRDERSTSHRQADALMDIVHAATGSGTLSGSSRLGHRGGEPPRIVLITTPDDLTAARTTADTEARERSAANAPAKGRATPETSSENGCSECSSSSHRPDDDSGHPDDASPPSDARQRSTAQGPGDGADLGTGGHIGPRLLARFSCDAILERALLAPNGAILNLGRDVRTITPAQRRALHARDRGCVIPGCTVPAAWTEGHHIQWWSSNGPTDIGNLALVCRRHHSEVHARTWTLHMRDGLPWAIPPDWIDPHQQPMRNQYHQHTHQMRDLGTQLRLNLEQDQSSTDPDPPAAEAV